MDPSSNSSRSKKPQRRFQFIDNSNVGASGTNSTQVRRHVMQEYMREKRWESRAQAESEVLDAPTQSQTQSPARRATQSSRRAPPKSRIKSRVNQASLTPKHGINTQAPKSASAQVDESASSLPCDSDSSSRQRQVNDRLDTIEDIPRSFAPATELERKPVRRGFYLTPQSFASLADITDLSPAILTSSSTSSNSLSPNPSLFSQRGSNSRWDSSSPEPSSILSAARTDPFNCLPMKLSRRDQELFDFYATVMPACSYGFERRSPRAHNWYLSVFIPEAMKSPVAFQNTILVHAANTQAWVQGLSETALAIEHRARASQMLSQQFQKSPYDTSDAAISSTLSAAALEDFDPRLERRTYAWMHWNAAMQKIRDRGGPPALEQNHSLRMLINWSDYIFSGYDGHGSSFFFDHRPTQVHRNKAAAEVNGRNELIRQCDDFIIFLKCAESLALVATNMRDNPTVRLDQPLRYSVFTTGQPLHSLLSSPNGPRYTESGQLKQIISRLAALMTINVAIWEYRYSTNASEEFFQELVENVMYNNLDRHISVEALLQILLSGSQKPTLLHTERPWLVGRLLKVAKRLSRNSWEKLNDFLLQCLTLQPPWRSFVEDWQKELREEILSAPLVSHVLPLMQHP